MAAVEAVGEDAVKAAVVGATEAEAEAEIEAMVEAEAVAVAVAMAVAVVAAAAADRAAWRQWRRMWRPRRWRWTTRMDVVGMRTRSRTRAAAEVAEQGGGGTAERRTAGNGRQGMGRAARQRVARVAAVDTDMTDMEVTVVHRRRRREADEVGAIVKVPKLRDKT